MMNDPLLRAWLDRQITTMEYAAMAVLHRANVRPAPLTLEQWTAVLRQAADVVTGSKVHV